MLVLLVHKLSHHTVQDFQIAGNSCRVSDTALYGNIQSMIDESQSEWSKFRNMTFVDNKSNRTIRSEASFKK